MNTQVATRNSTQVAALQNLKHGLANVQAAIPVTNTEPFLRMQRDGLWVYGAENIEVEEGSRWAGNPLSIKHGYVCWTDYDQKKGKRKNEKLGSRMVPATENKPDPASLPLYDDGNGGKWPWTDCASITFVCVSGEDKGTQTLYTTNSVGGLNAMSKLIGEIMTQLDKDPDRCVPVIELLNDTYTHSTWGKQWIPIFALRDWVPLTDDLPDLDEEEAGEAQAEPAATTQQTTATTPPPAAEPARRRRAAGAVPDAKPTEQQTANAAQSGASGDGAVRRRRRTS